MIEDMVWNVRAKTSTGRDVAVGFRRGDIGTLLVTPSRNRPNRARQRLISDDLFSGNHNAFCSYLNAAVGRCALCNLPP